MSDETEKTRVNYTFYFSEDHGLIRWNTANGPPEVYSNGHWEPGSRYVLNALTGTGDDPYSCGEWPCEDWSLDQAQEYALRNNIDLFSPVEFPDRKFPEFFDRVSEFIWRILDFIETNFDRIRYRRRV